MSNVKTSKEDRFKTLSKTNKAWRHYSGQMAYPFLIKKWIKKFVPNLDSRPTTKTTNTETIMESYRFMNNQWENGTDAESGGGLKEAFFSPMRCLCCMEGMKAGCVSDWSVAETTHVLEQPGTGTRMLQSTCSICYSGKHCTRIVLEHSQELRGKKETNMSCHHSAFVHWFAFNVNFTCNG